MDLNGDGKSNGLDFALFEEMNSGGGDGSGCGLGCGGLVLIALVVFSIIKFIAGCIY